jgi:hypothetical protein
MTQSPSTNSIAIDDTNTSNIEQSPMPPTSLLHSTPSNAAPIRQRSCDIIDSKMLSSAAAKTGNTYATTTTTTTTTTTSKSLQVNSGNSSNYSSTHSLIQLNSPLNISNSNTVTTPPHNQTSGNNNMTNNFLNPVFQNNKSQMRKSATVQNQQTLTNLQKATHMPPNQKNHNATSFLSPSSSSKSLIQQQQQQQQQQYNTVTPGGEPLNVLLDPIVINDPPTQALLLTVLATLVRNSTDENEIRILYRYIAEASIVFPKVFPVINQLLDSKINHILQSSMDESILDSVQSIIQNMIYSCESGAETNQQQLSYLQSCGFGGLWRFAQPFAVGREKPENVELFIDCLEAMVETCLPQFDTESVSMLMGGSITGGTSESSSLIVNNNNSNNTSSYHHSHAANTTNLAYNQSLSNSISTNPTPAAHTSNLNTFFNMSSMSSLITAGSMSSISMDHLDRGDVYDLNDMNNFHHHHLHRARTNSIRRNSSPRNNIF